MERPVEQRVARLESHVEHIQSDVADLRIELRDRTSKLEQKIEKLDQKIERLDPKIGSLDDKFDHKFDLLRESQAELRLSMERSFTKIMLWGIALYIAMTGSLLGVMAKGFGWIR